MALLTKIADRISRFYAERIEPLIFELRLHRRLQPFGLEERSQVPTAKLDFGYTPACQSPLCKPLSLRYEKYYRRFCYWHSLGATSNYQGIGHARVNRFKKIQ